MDTRTIVRVNNVDIVATSDEQMVAIKPICEALNIDYSRQLKKLKEDQDLSSVMGVTPITAADGKRYETCCLPVRYIFGWLFTINPQNVKPEAQDAVRAYRRMCYDALYQYFFGGQARQIEQNRAEIALLEEIAELNQQQSNLKLQLNDRKRKLEKLREERLNNEPTIF